jgi:hypothetical protein
MIYLGYPVRCVEAFRIFGQKMEHPLYDFQNDLQLSKYLNKYNLLFESTDKGQYIIGIKIEEFSDMWNKFTNIDDSIILLLTVKNEFKKRMTLANADIKTVTIEFMESGFDEGKTLHNPEPFVLSW